MLSARSHEAKRGVNGGKGREAQPDVFIGAQRKPLRQTGRRPLKVRRSATPP